MSQAILIGWEGYDDYVKDSLDVYKCGVYNAGYFK